MELRRDKDGNPAMRVLTTIRNVGREVNGLMVFETSPLREADLKDSPHWPLNVRDNRIVVDPHGRITPNTPLLMRYRPGVYELGEAGPEANGPFPGVVGRIVAGYRERVSAQEVVC